MTRQETIQIISLLASNYDKIADKTKEQKQFMITTWYECLKDLDYKLVLQSIKKTLIDSPYPPTIHEVRKNAIEIMTPEKTKTPIEAWNEALKMISNGIYMTKEQFETASPEVKKFFGSVSQVKELAMLDSDTVNTVTKGQFLKQYDILIARQKEEKLLPSEYNNLLSDLSNHFSLPQ